MKHITKKIAAAVMAFSLLGTFPALADLSAANSLTAEAVSKVVDPNTPHNHGYATYYYGHMRDEYDKPIYAIKYPNLKIGYKRVERVYDVWICLGCQRPAKKKLIQSTVKSSHYYWWYLMNPKAYNGF